MNNLRVFKEVRNVCNTIRVFDFDNNIFTQYNTAENANFPFGVPFTKTAKEMGYKDLKECYKSLKNRNQLGEEIDYKEQREAERLGYIYLGVERIKQHNRINTNDFADVCDKLGKYGMNFVDAQNVITAQYLYETGEVKTNERL